MRKLFRLSYLFKGRQSSFENSVLASALSKPTWEISRHRNIMHLHDLEPEVGFLSYIAPNATVVGEVHIGGRVAVWYGSVIRGDMNEVMILNDVSIGERTVIHTAASLPTGVPASVSIGNFVVIQPNCTLYSCIIGSECLIGHRSVILEGAKLEDGCAIGPNSVVPPGRIIPANQLWAGNPVQYIRDLERGEIHNFIVLAQLQMGQANGHMYEFLPFNNSYLLKRNSQDDLNPKELVYTHVYHDRELKDMDKI